MSMMNLPAARFPHAVSSLPARSLRRTTPRRASVVAGLLVGLREGGLLAFAVLVYFLVRGLVDADPAVALRHAYSMVDLERALGLFHEPALQQQVLQYPVLVDALNAIYVYGHWPLIAVTLGWLFLRHRSAFHEIRLAMILSGLVGFACFFLFPMAPPRFLPELGFVDTVVLHSDAYRVLQPPSMTNQYAAMPSLHVGWNLLMGIAIVRNASSRWLRAFGVCMPLAMWATTVLTGNHFLLDGLVGSTIVLAMLALVRWWRRTDGMRSLRFLGTA